MLQLAQVEWLDDSSCNVILESEAYAQKAVERHALQSKSAMSRQAIQELAAEANEPWTRTRPLSAGSKDVARAWHRMQRVGSSRLPWLLFPGCQEGQGSAWCLKRAWCQPCGLSG